MNTSRRGARQTIHVPSYLLQISSNYLRGSSLFHETLKVQSGLEIAGNTEIYFSIEFFER